MVISEVSVHAVSHGRPSSTDRFVLGRAPRRAGALSPASPRIGAVGGPFAVGLLKGIAEPHDAARIGAMAEPEGMASSPALERSQSIP